MNPRHVFIATPVLMIGGTEVQTLSLVRVLVSSGYRVSVCCYYEYEPTMVEEMKAAGAEVILMELLRSDGLLYLAKRLMGILKEHQPHIVHVQYVAPGFIPIVAARFAGIRTVFATVHQPGRTHGWKAIFLLRSVSRLCTAFFCVSRSVEESWFGSSKPLSPHVVKQRGNHFTLYNAVNIDRIEQVIGETDPVQVKESLNIGNKRVIGVVARLRREKGHHVLLDAMSEVIKALPDTVLLVVGDGPDREHLKVQAENLGIAGHVMWLDQKCQEEVYQLYSIMDAVAVPSLFEGFGLSAAEAMAAGLPVVGTKVDGLAEVVEDGVTGYLAPVGDSCALTKALTRILLDSTQSIAMGRRGRSRVKELFSIERFNASVTDAYGLFFNS